MGWSSQLCSQLCLGSQGMWSQDGHRGVSVLSPAVLGASSPWCPWARGAAHPCSFQSRLCQGRRGWSQLCVLLLCLRQEWDLSPDELRCLQTPRPPTCPVPAPGGSSESQDSHARALRCGDQEGKARCRWGQLLTGLLTPAAGTPQVRARGGITGFQWEFQSPAREGPRAGGALSRLIPSWAFPGGADAVQHGAERGQEPVAREYLDPDPLPALGETCTSCWEWGWGMGLGKWDWEIRLENLTGKWEREICLGYQTGKWYWEV